MAEKEEKHGDATHISICKAKNGYKLCFTYENKDMSLGQRAGWVPMSSCDSDDYVEKTKEAVLNRMKECM